MLFLLVAFLGIQIKVFRMLRRKVYHVQVGNKLESMLLVCGKNGYWQRKTV